MRRRAALAAGALLALAAVVAGLTVWPGGPGHRGAPAAVSAPPATTARTPGSTGGTSTSPSPAAAHPGRFFPDGDPMNRRRPGARRAPDSADMVGELLSSGARVYSARAGMPLYRATGHTPSFDTTPRRDPADALAGTRLPWDPAWHLPGPDARDWSVVTARGETAVECQGLQVADGRPSCAHGAVTDLAKGSVPRCGEPSGSGLSRLAGVITKDDWKARRIGHALAFGRPDNANTWVYPAVTSEVKDAAAGAGRHWHEGQYIWLDRSYDIDHDTSLKPYERVIAHALQDYGAYDLKTTSEFAFTSEYGAVPPGAGDSPYPSLKGIDFATYLRVGTVSPPEGRPSAPAPCDQRGA